MTGTHVPAQPGGAGGSGGSGEPPGLRKAPAAAPPPAPLPPTPPGASEATRLLCAGTYLDDTFRDAVIDELYVHEERFAAPSLGIDAARVLAHALRARRLELGWSAAILLAWVVSLPLSRGLTSAYLIPVALLGLARFVRRLAPTVWFVRGFAFVLRWYARVTLFLFLVGMVTTAFASTLLLPALSPLGLINALLSDTGLTGSSSGGGWSDGGGGSDSSGPGFGFGFAVWVTLLLPVLVAALVALQRGQFARALAHELSPERFPDVRSDPAEHAEGIRFQRLRERIRIEQHGPLVMYRPGDPFCGAGEPFKPWSLSVELVPRAGTTTVPLDNGEILARIVPLVEALRVPSGSPETADAVRDRLRSLEIDQCVFLPADGLPTRAAAPYDPAALEQHRAAALEEGGETRRHFLRIRVGGWNEGVVTTVFVRVHTQGGMLMMEVAPHVLWPLRPLFQNADRIAHQYRHHHRFGRAVWALTNTPRAAGEAVLTLLRGLGGGWGRATEGHGAALPEGPAASVRELGATDDASLFQYMDVARYLKTIQQRVAAGVTSALRDAGYQTAEFEQRIVHVADGGVYVESAQGAIGIGDHNTITNNGDPAPKSDPASQKGRS
ncbi:hypothetical protein ADL22_23985 [Streptomyces sp. NRRL F-4489]|uniref:hypothetical protein n=1 Tax=Streptomyces sp. NRRL F-4489 TaxID=1609095 RepID=UPI00074A724D|nr:hypothetical protein [Streptomyces sp. NRRL F-4489]KUL36517.1 hypothetical protein ADL22_23985 [Streptomyces sp. NRRL F-4489]